MKKRIAIATWVGNTSLNYGCTSQAVAMQELIRQCGCEPVTINHYFEGETGFWGVCRRHYLTARSLGVGYIRTSRKFHRFFRKYVTLSPLCKNDSDVVQYVKGGGFDILLCGSDAIWLERWIRALFLWDYKELNHPAIAYAPSVPNGKIIYANFEKALKRFVAIGGREFKLAELIAGYTDKKIETVLDPVLAVDESFWHQKTHKRLVEEPYVLCYFLSDPEYHAISIDLVKKKYNAKRVVYINTDYIDRRNKKYSEYRGGDYKGIVGPEEFYTLFKYADAVCTDSFHGSCFSIIFRKNFFVFARPGLWEIRSDNRFCSLFSQLNLQNRCVEKNIDIQRMEDIDYSVVEQYLFDRREHSVKFLQDAIDKCASAEAL